MPLLTSRKIGVGVVLRDKQGNLKATMKSSNICTTPLCAETVAMLEGLWVAKEMNVKCVTILSDSLSLICIIHKEVSSVILTLPLLSGRT